MRKIIVILLTLTMLLGFSAVAAQANEPAHIYIMVDANVLGNGLWWAPQRVAFTPGENALEITMRELGASALVTGEFLFGISIDGEVLQAGDYAAFSGWMLTINNEMTMLGAANEFPQAGDVIRWEFSLDFGVDIGFEGWDGAPPAIDRADMSELIRAASMACSVWLANDALPVLNNLTATQEEVDAAIASFHDYQLGCACHWGPLVPPWIAAILRAWNWIVSAWNALVAWIVGLLLWPPRLCFPAFVPWGSWLC